MSGRLSKGGLIDRGVSLGFRFDGKPLTGHAGDTLASALLASGETLIGRSFKYHRPRGVLTAGPEEPNALVELRSEGKTVAMPDVFIPLAEEAGLICGTTWYSLSNSLRMAAEFADLPVAVNISANNLLDNTFAGKLRDLLARSAVPARLLELEVTESAVMRYPEVMLKRLHEIRGMGVKMSIDDFGTGYASLAYLKHLPVDTLKIDKLFITNVDTDAGDRLIVRSAIQLAHGFGMSVVAEGVETAVVATLLAEEGCDFAQGYHFSHPVPAPAFAQLCQ